MLAIMNDSRNGTTDPSPSKAPAAMPTIAGTAAGAIRSPRQLKCIVSLFAIVRIVCDFRLRNSFVALAHVRHHRASVAPADPYFGSGETNVGSEPSWRRCRGPAWSARTRRHPRGGMSEPQQHLAAAPAHAASRGTGFALDICSGEVSADRWLAALRPYVRNGSIAIVSPGLRPG
jgi:hypothetical protein